MALEKSHLATKKKKNKFSNISNNMWTNRCLKITEKYKFIYIYISSVLAFCYGEFVNVSFMVHIIIYIDIYIHLQLSEAERSIKHTCKQVTVTSLMCIS